MTIQASCQGVVPFSLNRMNIDQNLLATYLLVAIYTYRNMATLLGPILPDGVRTRV